MSGRLVHKLVVVGEDTGYGMTAFHIRAYKNDPFLENVLTTNVTVMIWKKSPVTLKSVCLKLGETGYHVLFPAESVSKSEKDCVMENFVQLRTNKPGHVINRLVTEKVVVS